MKMVGKCEKYEFDVTDEQGETILRVKFDKAEFEFDTEKLGGELNNIFDQFHAFGKKIAEA